METYDEILNRMKDSYESCAGFAPCEESDIMIRLRVLAGEIYRLKADAAFITRQLFPTTATGEYLDLHAAERGLTRKDAVKAIGEVTFTPDAEEHPAILIPAGTEVCTYAGLLRFTTDSDALLATNADSVTVSVTAAEAGADSNARAGTVSIIVTPVTGIGAVNNESAFENGADCESDDALRRRVIDSYVNIVSGANAAYYRSIAMSVPGVYSASVVGRARGTGTVNVYLSGLGTSVSSAVKAQVQSLMNEGRELNVDVLVCDAQPVSIPLYIRLAVKAGYAFDTVAGAVQSAVTAFINGLGTGRDVRLSDVGEVVYHTEGVANYRFVDSYGSDTVIDETQYPVAGSIIVRERA